LFEGLQVRGVCLDDVLATVEVLVVFAGLFHGRSKLSIHLLLLVHASVLGNILQLGPDDQATVIETQSEMVSISRDVKGENLRWELDLVIDGELIFVRSTNVEKFQLTIHTTCNHTLSRSVVFHLEARLLERVEIIESPDLSTIILAESQRVSMSDYHLSIETAKVLNGVFDSKLTDTLSCVPQVPHLDTLIGRSTDQCVLVCEGDLFDVVGVGGQDLNLALVCVVLHIVKAQSRVIAATREIPQIFCKSQRVYPSIAAVLVTSQDILVFELKKLYFAPSVTRQEKLSV
jgi:hypothetical protein